MKKTIKVKQNIDNFIKWYNSTIELCLAGKEITKKVDALFPIITKTTLKLFITKRDYTILDDLLLQKSPVKQSLTLKLLFEKRSKFWLIGSLEKLRQKIEGELDRVGSRSKIFSSSMNQKEILGLILWTVSFSLIAEKAAKKDPQMGKPAREAKRVIEQLYDDFIKPNRKTSNDSNIHYEGINESSLGFIKKYGLVNFINRFQISRKQNKQTVHDHTQVLENWNFYEEDINICLPISIGCPNGCAMCLVGTAYHGKGADTVLDSQMIFNLLYKNSLINQEIVNLPFEAKKIKIYMLGGGDPANQITNFKKTIKIIHNFYQKTSTPFLKWVRDNHLKDEQNENYFSIIASTLGIKNKSIDQLIKLGTIYPEFGLQLSICSFNQKIRELCVRLKNVFSIEETIYQAARFYDATRRRGYLNIFLFDKIYDNPKRVLTDIERAMDKSEKIYKFNGAKDKIHITLDALNNAPSSFPCRRAKKAKFESLKKLLIKRGYEVSIYNPPRDNQTREGCGSLHPETIKMLR